MKIVTDYEVEGCWTSMDKKEKTRCRKCGAILKLVPKKNHFNSKYWRLQRNDGLLLVCCPKGCAEKDAVKAYQTFSKIQEWCTKNSKSWNYKLDYFKIRNAWIDRDGRVYPLRYREHSAFADDVLNLSENDLEIAGWIKLSRNYFYWTTTLSQSQQNTIFDLLTGWDKAHMIKDFQKAIDNDENCFEPFGID